MRVLLEWSRNLFIYIIVQSTSQTLLSQMAPGIFPVSLDELVNLASTIRLGSHKTALPKPNTLKLPKAVVLVGAAHHSQKISISTGFSLVCTLPTLPRNLCQPQRQTAASLF